MLPGFWTTVVFILGRRSTFLWKFFFLNDKPFSAFSLRALSSSSSCFLAATANNKKKTTTGGHDQGAPAARGDTCSYGRKTCLAVTYSRRSRTLHTRGRHMARWWSPLEAQAHDCEVSFPLPASHMELRQETINHRILAAAMNCENDDVLKHMKWIEMILIIQWNQYFFCMFCQTQTLTAKTRSK